MTTPQSQNLQIDPASGLAINCHNCIHCDRTQSYIIGPAYGRCMKVGGYYCSVVHNFPENFGHLCNNYNSWAPREKTIRELISDKIRKMLSDK